MDKSSYNSKFFGISKLQFDIKYHRFFVGLFVLFFTLLEKDLFCVEQESDHLIFQPQFQIFQDDRQMINDHFNDSDFSYYFPYSLQNKTLPSYHRELPTFIIRGENNTKNNNDNDKVRQGMYQGAEFSMSYLPGWGQRGLQMTQIQAKANFGLPTPFKNTFVSITPSFSPTLTDWKGVEPFPRTLLTAAMDFRFIKKICPQLTAMASVTPQWSSDGHESQDALRFSMMGNIIWNPSERLKVVLGVGYFAQNDNKVLPFGGLIWQPNDDWKFELMAPQLRVAKRWKSNIPSFLNHTASYWQYVGIGFGSKSWAIESVADQSDVAKYKEYSVVIGLEAKNHESFSWKVELGYVFSRTIRFEEYTMSKLHISDSMLIRISCSF
jgi:hypothetical protein